MGNRSSVTDEGLATSDLVKKLKLSEKKYRAFVEFSPSIIYLLDPRGNFIFLGGALERLTGFTPSEFEGRPFSSLVWEGDRRKIRWSPPETVGGSQSIRGRELRFRIKEGGEYKTFELWYLYVQLHSFGLQDCTGSSTTKDFIGIYGIAMDITERKLRHDSLKRSNEKLLRDQDRRKALCMRLIEWVERERQHMVTDVCEQLAESLTGLKMELEDLVRRLKPAQFELREVASSTIRRTAKIMGEIKERAHMLRPRMLDTLGIVPAIKGLAEETARNSGLEVLLFTKDVPRIIPPDKELALYRIAQEAIANAVKHANATKVFINLIGAEDRVLLSIEDDGDGFEEDKWSENEKGALGLLLMQERAIHVGGRFSLDSGRGRGTQIWAEIPI
ncbi:MAG: PAS domain S-box protein [Deltaproteobacteria bacterium]|nr:PAS domain S-box protein [Deltaproteobacteria bacterium]MBW1928381.1 PAS domain S-box protein [Deltaproteobacteria bacterium]MBW2023820.1 PAS domain S-box protein [Deltaproteobacteria bacterium]MBW2124567.1 PAS domain S-box protein [Deltaproteobacteria bacterium]RLB23166.1 MAG: hypothetical protein DRG76_04910 [Deltaproteobacteria bacterium]